jgi:tetratricopeptide (TPR) repeat protein
MGDHEAAVRAYATALVHDPDYAAAHYNIGNAYAQSGRSEAALPAYRRAIALKPDFVDAEVALGSALDDLGRLEDAEASYRRALAMRPDYVEVHNNLGLTLEKLGRLEDPLRRVTAGARLKPDDNDTRNNLGILTDLGQLRPRRDLPEAEDLPRRARTAQQPWQCPQIARRLSCGDCEFRRALRSSRFLGRHVQPGQCTAIHRHAAPAAEVFAGVNLGPSSFDALQSRQHFPSIGLLGGALSYRRTLELKPDHFIAHNNVGNVLNDLGRSRGAAVASFREALRINLIRPSSNNLLFGLNYRSTRRLGNAPEGAAMASSRRGKRVPYGLPNTGPRAPTARGLVSGDLRDHAIGHSKARWPRSQPMLPGKWDLPATHVVPTRSPTGFGRPSRLVPAVRLSDEAFAKRV